jgi:hypothetical protein
MLRWLAALVASSFTFALADVLCDICSAPPRAPAAPTARAHSHRFFFL